jgi:hypothetical protein
MMCLVECRAGSREDGANLRRRVKDRQNEGEREMMMEARIDNPTRTAS